jgi:hypothetical protein
MPVVRGAVSVTGHTLRWPTAMSSSRTPSRKFNAQASTGEHGTSLLDFSAFTMHAAGERCSAPDNVSGLCRLKVLFGDAYNRVDAIRAECFCHPKERQVQRSREQTFIVAQCFQPMEESWVSHRAFGDDASHTDGICAGSGMTGRCDISCIQTPPQGARIVNAARGYHEVSKNGHHISWN